MAKISTRKKKLTALGVHIFGGGFTCGVKQSGFNVLAHFEDTKYGVSTVHANWPKLPVYVGEENWPVAKFVDKVDFLYSNPPCAIFSTAGVCTTKGADAWKTDPRLGCWYRAFQVFEEVQPKVFALESVCQAYTKGKEVVDEFTRKAINLGYSVQHVLVDSQWAGIPQSRKRFFFVAHRPNLPIGFQFTFTPPAGILQTLAKINNPGQVTKIGRLQKYVRQTPQGGNLCDAFDAANQKLLQNTTGRIPGRPGFLYKRLRGDKPMGAFIGDLFIHPIKHRFLGINEMKVICGYPETFQLAGSKGGWPSLLARAVLPPVGKWLATSVKAAIRKPLQNTPPCTISFIDIRKPEQMPVKLKAKTVKKVVNKVASSNKKPRSKAAGSGKFIRELLQTGNYSAAQIVQLVHKNYPKSKATVKDVAWNKRKLLLSDENFSPQPTAKKKKPAHLDVDRQFDTTSLTVKSSTGQCVHRDYGAHFFRWGFAGAFVKQDITDVLDVGCGSDLPLIGVLSKPRPLVPRRYVGVDIRKEPRTTVKRGWATVHWEFNFIKRYKELGQFNLAICFEVLEHMKKANGKQLLTCLQKCLTPDGTLLLSTPVFNGKAAANHLYEWEAAELQKAILKAGFQVVNRFGTFASYHPLKKVITVEEKLLLDRLRAYYSNEVMACFLAPLYPDASRNNVWVLKRA